MSRSVLAVVFFIGVVGCGQKPPAHADKGDQRETTQHEQAPAIDTSGDKEVESIVRDVVAAQLHVDPKKLDMKKPIADEIDAVLIVMDLEERCNLEIPDPIIKKHTRTDLGDPGCKPSPAQLVAIITESKSAATSNHPEPDGKTADDLRGTWVGKKAIVRGIESNFTAIYEFAGSKINTFLTITNQKGNWKYRTNPSRNPKEIDLTPLDGPFAGKTVKGIYRLEKDVLTICYIQLSLEDAEKKERPSVFESKKGDDVVLLTFERKRR